MSINSVISKLQKLNNSNLVKVYVPSAKKVMEFTQLSVKQQKELIKTGLDGAISGVTISNIMSQIILDNSVETYDFLTVDKFPIILALRRVSFGETVKVKDDDKETTFNLGDILDNNLKFEDDFVKTLSFKDEELEISLSVPSLKLDIKANDQQISTFKKNKDAEISDTVGSLFIFEIAKFVNKVKVGGEEMDLTSLQFKDRVSVIESIPAYLSNKILDYIQGFRKTEMDYVTVNGDVLPVDARLFAKETEK
jgi:hypothetical protein